MGGNELTYIQEAFEANYIAPLGRNVDLFEEAVKNYTGATNALAVVSGTAAIHLALRVLGVGPEDEVWASSFTFIGSVAPILYERAIPYFLDSDLASWNLDPDLLEEELRKAAARGKLPKALILTHLYGQPANLSRIVALCDAYGVTLIEDAAESLGATFEGRHTGTFGLMGAYSFNGNKIITTSGGGMLVGHNKTLLERARFLSTQAREPVLHYEHETYGYNYRMSNIVAGIGRGQMEVLGERVRRKREIFERYKEAFASCDAISLMPELPQAQGNRWLTTITVEGIPPSRLIRKLEEHNIESRPLWKPMHAQPLFKDAKATVTGVSDALFAKGVCLPSGTAMSNEQIAMIAQLILDEVNHG